MEAAFKADLTAVLVAVHPAPDGRGVLPVVLTLADGALPAGPLAPEHRSLQAGLRSWVEHTTRHPLGHVEQLYTFADRDRTREGGGDPVRAISISYLALTRTTPEETGWVDWYAHFPWEDQRGEAGRRLLAALSARLDAWCREAPDALRETRLKRVSGAFSAGDWQDELVLQRYELLFEAGLVPEAGGALFEPAGRPMPRDHRRILATGIARLRAKIKYRPVFFELLPERFTFLELQDTVEALSGVRLHKPNFRRLIAQQNLIEDTGQISADRPGRPAKLLRFRREILEARAIAGTKLPLLPTR
ncbi:hypothetical protein NFI95_11050 [Acetobacteraceae bacterium KSS8]|uniref:NrtR DNA-binding winged helix domain-containing protein n=1 Tax=Endosaccharibacter trunci TaxID=2812733 RepID=A0ABT1W7W4_9PROT|nr:hypothetical protein [Acetobacteraceae bacterium KSS8]